MEVNRKYYGSRDVCKILGIHFQTLNNWEKNGKIECIRTPGGKRLYDLSLFLEKTKGLKESQKDEEDGKEIKKLKICYCRVSTLGQKNDLERQVTLMKEKYTDHIIIKDIGSGLNFKRKGLIKIIDLAINGEVEEVVIAYKDRLARFGYEMIEYIIENYSDGKITILNEVELSPTEEITKDLVTIINVFSARVNGLRKYKKKVQKLEI